VRDTAHDPAGGVAVDAVAPFEPEVLDVGADGLRDTQPVEGEQADQRVIPATGQPRGDQHGADLVAIQASDAGLVVQARSTHMGRRRDRDETLVSSWAFVDWCVGSDSCGKYFLHAC
jgi:hypothetical protein